MEILTTQTFKNKVFDFEKHKDWKFNGARPAIIDFYADWCGPCHMLTPILENVAKTYSGVVDIYKINTESTPDLAALFGIRGIPSLLFIPLEGEPTMSSGVIPEETFDRAISEIFKINKPK